MNIGMLWFDNDPKTALDDKILRAATYYQNKYGQAPNVCFVHPSMLPETSKKNAGNVEVRKSRSVLVNHFWLGVNNSAA